MADPLDPPDPPDPPDPHDPEDPRLVRNISDTARWVAVYRARETERPDAVFSDPFARDLAGERGQRIAASLADDNMEWATIARTYAFDRMVMTQVEEGLDLVVN